MGIKKRFGIKQKQKVKRRKRRTKLKEQKVNPDERFYGRFYVGR